VNLSSSSVEEDSDDVSPFSAVSRIKEFSRYSPLILRRKKTSVFPVVGGVVNKIFNRHTLHEPVFERLFRKNAITEELVDTYKSCILSKVSNSVSSIFCCGKGQELDEFCNSISASFCKHTV
jgi:hypothetical protein